MQQLLMMLLASTFAVADGFALTQTPPTQAVFYRDGRSNPRLWRDINVYRDNPLVLVDRAVDKRFSPVIEIESVRPVKDRNGNDSHIYGSGFMISPCHALTNHHVVFGDDLKVIPGENYDMKVRAGVGTDVPFAGNTIAVPVTWGRRDNLGRQDWALIRLKSCIGRRSDVLWYRLSGKNNVQLIDTAVMAVGFSGEHARGQLVLSSGHVNGFDMDSQMLKVSASWLSGESGGPVLIQSGDDLTIAGMITASVVNWRNNKRIDYFEMFTDENANKMTNVVDILQCEKVLSIIAPELQDPTRIFPFSPNKQLSDSLATTFKYNPARQRVEC